MSRLVVRAFSVSLDGFGAGVSQSLQHPLGIGGPTLHSWFFPTATFQKSVLGKDGGTTGPDDDIAARSMQGMGAWILGRNMFAHSRGPWTDDGWRGWWGDEPPYHVPVFVLTHHAREPLPMKGGTTFHFVTGGIHEAHERAREAAGNRDIRVGGGVSTVRQFLSERLVDEMHVAFSPVLLGRGESLFAGLDLPALGYRVASHVNTEAASHVTFVRE